MDRNARTRLRRTLAIIVEMLVRGEYRELEALTNGVRLKAEHMEAGIVEYGRTLTNPPIEAYADIDIVQIEERTPSEYSIRFQLFTEEEGQSDLEIQATLIDDDATANQMRVELDNILVA